LELTTAGLLSRDVDLGRVFEDAVGAGADARTVANWLTGEVTAWLRKESRLLPDSHLDGAALAELEAMVGAGDLSATAAKDVLAGVLSGEGRPAEVAESRDLIQVSDSASLEPAVDVVLAANSDAFEKLKSGDEKVMGFLIGQVMRSTGGKADPAAVTRIIKERAG
jgi:aspartyl-tRNA(Asn)/glutamyl-tRNA(Gln) amidotransferase subunit B